jgi:hypothetical protein
VRAPVQEGNPAKLDQGPVHLAQRPDSSAHDARFPE